MPQKKLSNLKYHIFLIRIFGKKIIIKITVEKPMKLKKKKKKSIVGQNLIVWTLHFGDDCGDGE